MAAKVMIPSTLLKKMKESKGWEFGWDQGSKGEYKVTLFRTRQGQRLYLGIDRSGEILIHTNPTFNNGEPVGPDYFKFDPNDIVALVGVRKVKTGFWPWSYKMEDFDLVSIE